jgi:phosphatidylglycerol:prolipoprotein diacylglycerol transferase
LSSFLPVPDPIAFSIFGIDVRWYGVLVTLGICAGGFVFYKRAPKRGIDQDRALDILLWGTVLGVIGARLYYVVFEWERYAGDLKEIFNLRGGGLAIHGGLIFGIGTAVFLLRRWKIDPLKCLDALIPGFPIGQAIGRWGNYFNSEAHGGPTDLPWAIEVDGQLVHPTFLYESIWCLLLFVFLILFDRYVKQGRFDGQLVMFYGFFYSVERLIVEGLRTDSLIIGSFKQAQVLSILIMVACGVGYAYLARAGEEKEAAESAALSGGNAAAEGASGASSQAAEEPAAAEAVTEVSAEGSGASVQAGSGDSYQESYQADYQASYRDDYQE